MILSFGRSAFCRSRWNAGGRAFFGRGGPKCGRNRRARSDCPIGVDTARHFKAPCPYRLFIPQGGAGQHCHDQHGNGIGTQTRRSFHSILSSPTRGELSFASSIAFVRTKIKAYDMSTEGRPSSGRSCLFPLFKEHARGLAPRPFSLPPLGVLWPSAETRG